METDMKGIRFEGFYGHMKLLSFPDFRNFRQTLISTDSLF